MSKSTKEKTEREPGSARVSRPRCSADPRSQGDAPTVEDRETCGRRRRAGQETLPEPVLGWSVELALTHHPASRCVFATHPTRWQAQCPSARRFSEPCETTFRVAGKLESPESS